MSNQNKKKMFYVIETFYGESGVQDKFETEAEAEKECLRLQGFFPDSTFFVEYSEHGEPPFINC
jgi:hypothetical protein